MYIFLTQIAGLSFLQRRVAATAPLEKLLLMYIKPFELAALIRTALDNKDLPKMQPLPSLNTVFSKWDAVSPRLLLCACHEMFFAFASCCFHEPLDTSEA